MTFLGRSRSVLRTTKGTSHQGGPLLPCCLFSADACNFTAADQGTHTFTSGFTLMTPGAWALTAADRADGLSASLTLPVNR
jgi:hypothetical protein